jgi:hypothetical protein
MPTTPKGRREHLSANGGGNKIPEEEMPKRTPDSGAENGGMERVQTGEETASMEYSPYGDGGIAPRLICLTDMDTTETKWLENRPLINTRTGRKNAATDA